MPLRAGSQDNVSLLAEIVADSKASGETTACSAMHGATLRLNQRWSSGHGGGAEWCSVFAACAGGFDMIVDDGSHNPNHIIVSLDNLWAGVKPGGVYIIEVRMRGRCKVS